MELINDALTTCVGVYFLAAFVMLTIDTVAHLLRAGVDGIEVRLS